MGRRDPSVEDYDVFNKLKDLANTRLAAIVIIVVILLFMFVFSPSYKLRFSKEGLTLSDQETYTISYDSIRQVEYLESPDYGHYIDGAQTNRYVFGRWRNEQWGEYHLAVLNKVTHCVVLYTDGGVYAFNYEDDATTQSIYESLEEIIMTANE